MSVIPRKLLLLILISLVCVLFLYLYSIQLKDVQDVSPSASMATVPPSLQQETCPNIPNYPADIETNSVFSSLDLDPVWMQRREFWSGEYEDRYTRRRAMWPQLPLRVIVMPHSHTDPGWLNTVEGYFAKSTKSIITNIVNKLTQHQNMTFIWSEASYLWMWWEIADSESRARLRNLLETGRLEITTGGWVMTDEANVDFYSMVDQLVEGHEFMRTQLGVIPTSSWSVDSFGHGGAFPHLLSKAEIKNMVIMRIHYAWKEWLARYQNGDFLWKQRWEKDGSNAPLCHNFPYDIYSIKHGCGPNPQTCLGFDFRHVDGEYNEFTMHYTPINSANVKERAELLLDQYGRTGSLLRHNVVLVPLGDDFRYNNEVEFDQQYENYMKLMNYINQGNYNAHVSFGTLKDYFAEVRSRMKEFNTLSGDFFVYSDIFSEGRPAYWSGYFFTRPYTKLLSRQVASKLRAVEIVYSIGLAWTRTGAHSIPSDVLHSLYKDLVESRRALALFQHHDAITGTSKEFVMNDYEFKLKRALKKLNNLETILILYLIQEEKGEIMLNQPLLHTNPRNKGEDGSEEEVLDLRSGQHQKVILYNTMAHKVQRIGSVRTNLDNVCVEDQNGNMLEIQVAPVLNVVKDPKLDFSTFDVWFGISLEPLSLSAFTIRSCKVDRRPTRIYCLRCPESEKFPGIQLKGIPRGAVQLENQIYKLLFDESSKQLKTVTNKVNGVRKEVNLQFSSYTSEFYRSGAYLFSVEDDDGVPRETPLFTAADISDNLIVSGPVFSEIRVVWQVVGEGGPATFLHCVRLVHDTGPLSEAVHIQNMFDMGPSPNFRDTEFFMRLATDLKNGAERKMFTDQAGLGMVERTYAEQAHIEGNYFPVTESVYIEDETTRLTLLVDHATGAASRHPGWLEVMVDKRTMNDDARGMGEGVLDSRATHHRYTLLLEPRSPRKVRKQDSLPYLSLLALTLSRYLEHPPSSFVLKENDSRLSNSIGLLNTALPCDYDLVNLRSWNPDDKRKNADSLMILRRLAPDCSWTSLTLVDCLDLGYVPNMRFASLDSAFTKTSLTANHDVSVQSELFNLSPMEISSYNVTFT